MGDIDWVALIRDNLLGFVIGTVFFGTAFDLIRRGIDYLWNRRFRGWVIEVVPADPARPPYTHDLLWDEVRLFEESRIERRKFIQSVCSSEGGRLNEGEFSIDQPDGWVFRDKAARKYRFDISKMPGKTA
ncbi:MAG: hypothetical protein ACT4OK_16190 [Gemmobacter sp.]